MPAESGGAQRGVIVFKPILLYDDHPMLELIPEMKDRLNAARERAASLRDRL